MALRLSGIFWAWAALAASFSAPAAAATISVQAKAKVTKPLTLSSRQDFDLGTLTLGTGTWSGAVVRLARTGTLTCPANLGCSGATQVALYNVTGSHREMVTVITPNVTLVNQSDPTKTLQMVVDSPGTVQLPNSGNQGVTFPLGGSITLDSTTPGGVYSGTFNVSVDYQ